MSTKFLDNAGLAYFWGKIKSWITSRGYITSSGSITGNAATATRLAGPKHSYTTAANAAKNWYRIANANTSQMDTTKPIHAQFILTAYNTSYDTNYYERWFVNAEVFGRGSHIIIFGNSNIPFSQCRILYENTIDDLDSNDRPAIDIYLNYVLPNGTTKIEIEEVYNSGWTFVTDGQLAVSVVPTGFESQVCDGARGNGVLRSTYSDYATYIGLQRSDITSNITLADNNTYRSRVLNCTGTRTVTVPSINSAYSWFVIKNFNTTSGVITVHPSTTSVLIDGSNADIMLQPGEYIVIHSRAANSYSIIADGRRYQRCIVSVGNKNNFPYHRIASMPVQTGSYITRAITFLVNKDLRDHGYGICRIVFRTENVSSNQTAWVSVQWLVRTSNISVDCIQVGLNNTSGASYADVFYKSDGAYNNCIFRVLTHTFSSNTPACSYTVINSSREVDNTTASDPLTSIESYSSIEAAGTTLHNTNFTSIITASDMGVVGTANSCSGNAATASAVAWSGVTSKPTTISGYGITDAKIASGTITLGSATITPLTSHQSLDNYVTLNGVETISGGKTFSAITTFNNQIVFDNSDTIRKNNDTGMMRILGGSNSSSNPYLAVCGSSRTTDPGCFIFRAGDSTQNKRMVGSPSGTLTWDGQDIQISSDERIKTPLASVPNEVLDAWGEVQWGQFQYLEAVEAKGAGARLHIGLIAQRVKDAFGAKGLDACAYGILCHEQKEAAEDEPAADLWMVRYAEAQAMEAAYQRRRADRLEARVAALEEAMR